jgi:hypothetical protein
MPPVTCQNSENTSQQTSSVLPNSFARSRNLLRTSYRGAFGKSKFYTLMTTDSGVRLKLTPLSQVTQPSLWRRLLQLKCFGRNSLKRIYASYVSRYPFKEMILLQSIRNSSYLLGYNAVWTVKVKPTFRSNISPPSPLLYLLHAGFLIGLLFNLKDGGDMFL